MIDSDTESAYSQNRDWWESITRHHINGAMDIEGFLRGDYSLRGYVLEELGGINGKSLLHLQCHFGLDTLALARLGAQVTGVDFSPTAVQKARELAARANIPARFVESNVLELGDTFQDEFDVVFTTHGVVGWLHELDSWGKVIASSLKPGGLVYISEFHPYMLTIDDLGPITAETGMKVRYPYFNTGAAFESQPSQSSDYADPNFNPGIEFRFWQHSLSEIIGSLLQAGISIEYFAEHDYTVSPIIGGMVRESDGYHRMAPGLPRIPQMYSIRGRKLPHA
ncbi:MAG: class I SAM-dependent methyltransferase [Chloroflexi bacterium]|nr:class I SAM-dependent methyltransferase [Chloroflexota bacterium]